MAMYNEILVGRINRFLQKYLSMKGGPPAPQLASDIQVALNLFNGIENRFLEGWNRFGIVATNPATAGQQSSIRLRNPTNSGCVVVLEKIVFGNQNAAVVQGHNLQIGATTTDYGTIISPAIASLDARQGSINSVMVLSRTGAGAATNLGTSAFTTYLAASSGMADLILYDDQQFALLPGWAVQQINSNVNEVVASSWIWRERPLEDSEKF